MTKLLGLSTLLPHQTTNHSIKSADKTATLKALTHAHTQVKKYAHLTETRENEWKFSAQFTHLPVFHNGFSFTLSTIALSPYFILVLFKFLIYKKSYTQNADFKKKQSIFFSD